MKQILLVSNPFDPLNNLERFEVVKDLTPREWLAEHFGPDFVEFDKPTVLNWNGELIMRADWETRRIQEGDILSFVYVPQGVEVLVISIIVAVVVGVAAYLMMPDPKIPNNNTQNPDPVYTLRGQSNKFKPNEPIEVVYGSVRHWPSYACRPYSEYIGNLQYQYSLYCLGQGEVGIAAIQLDDTPIGAFPEVSLEIIPPGGSVTLVESAVFTSEEVSNIELLAPNETGYLISGPFVVNDWATPIHRLSVDVSFPQGLYELDDAGEIKSKAVTLLFEYIPIDASANPLPGAVWISFYPGVSLIITRKDNTPQRMTFTVNVGAGRYMVRGRRMSNKPSSTSAQTQCRWESAKAYAQGVGSFGNVTMIAMRALATNSLNDNTAKAFNVLMTRKLPTWTPGGGWGGNIVTRNPIWAFCDIFRAAYGAKLTDEYLDLPTLYSLAQVFDARYRCGRRNQA